MTLAHLATFVGGIVALPGVLLMLAGALGAVRLRDAYLRAHASSLVMSAGPALVLSGLAVVVWDASLSPRLLLLAAICVFLGPLMSHLAGAAVYASGVSHERDGESSTASTGAP
jgi:monovalent cation/proton antiporter MnhG/PhaG subunit